MGYRTLANDIAGIQLYRRGMLVVYILARATGSISDSADNGPPAADAIAVRELTSIKISPYPKKMAMIHAPQLMLLIFLHRKGSQFCGVICRSPLLSTDPFFFERRL
ncbi:uncharacterized protein CIMG_00298 [Coccidioides immitis RS]|uniref:Uncharacterized protein n=1 Tax=Coccidioides immitis (strain RS) TaxID=246410 RepID=J3KGQ1_COCIM|nr:uncharacterized protein CIMG_00298 [Coccidioides immitis RS]EAS34944.3 hypothetical protein CIMG_00298 [Coccidioides immitis RS]